MTEHSSPDDGTSNTDYAVALAEQASAEALARSRGQRYRHAQKAQGARAAGCRPAGRNPI